MSDVVHYRGTLQEIERFENESSEEQCKRLLQYTELEEFYDTYKEMLLDRYCYDIVELDGVLFRVTKENVNVDEDIFRLNRSEDGTMTFEVKYYNGGCGFTEAIEEAFKNYSNS
jgi:hypothetical protein